MCIFFKRWSVFYGVFDSFTDRPYGNPFPFITYLKPLPLNFYIFYAVCKERAFDFLYSMAASRDFLLYSGLPEDSYFEINA